MILRWKDDRRLVDLYMEEKEKRQNRRKKRKRIKKKGKEEVG